MLSIRHNLVLGFLEKSTCHPRTGSFCHPADPGMEGRGNVVRCLKGMGGMLVRNIAPAREE